MKKAQLFDVIAVDMSTHKIEVLAEGKSECAADSIEMMAIGRRGVETHFYATVESGKYKDGDEWCTDDEDE